jgi:NAD(P)-dependent dehydrogenase (short-subunit alcohol dehydrogenase family)
MSRSENLLSLKGRTAVVTGAAGGIGSEIALTFVNNGASVILLDAPSQKQALEGVSAKISQNLYGEPSQEILCASVDIAVKADIDDWALSVLQSGRHVDVLVNCAAVHRHSISIGKMDDQEWRRIFDVNINGSRYMIEALLPQMIERRTGSVINIASDSAFDAIAGESAYGISKAACVRMIAYLARENMHSGIRFNALAPGWVKTKIVQEFWDNPDFYAEAVAAIPAGRFADPNEIANAVLFLASDLSSYVNGHCLIVDGGRIAGNPI